MSDLELKDRIISLTDKEARQERLVNELIACMIDLDIESFERLLDTFILTKGIDKAITRVVFPFLHRIGILWMANHVNPAQEHLVTNIIRQKLIVGIEGMMTGRTAESCLNDEKAARDDLTKAWTSFSADDKSHCLSMVSTGGSPSYVELLSCLEMSRDAKKIAQGQNPNQGQPVVPRRRRR